jgi:hypothetical protein
MAHPSRSGSPSGAQNRRCSEQPGQSQSQRTDPSPRSAAVTAASVQPYASGTAEAGATRATCRSSAGAARERALSRMRPDCCLAGTRDPDGSDLDIDVELVEPWVGTEPLMRRDWPPLSSSSPTRRPDRPPARCAGGDGVLAAVLRTATRGRSRSRRGRSSCRPGCGSHPPCRRPGRTPVRPRSGPSCGSRRPSRRHGRSG